MTQSDSDTRKRDKMSDMDDVLVKIGDFGLYQKRVVFLVALVSFSTAFNNLGYVFWAARPDHHCMPSEELEQAGRLYNWTLEELINLTVPWVQENAVWKRSRCSIYDIPLNSLNRTSTLTEAESLPRGSQAALDETAKTEIELLLNSSPQAVDCKRWRYSMDLYASTIVTQWDLVCSSQWKVSLTQSVYMAGRIVGSVIYGHLSDRFGRRRSLLLAIILQVITSASGALMPYYYPFLVLRFLLGIHTTGEFQCAYIIATEYVGVRWRTLAGTVMQLYWAAAYMTVALMGYLIRDRTYLQLALSLPLTVLVLVVYCFIPETPRWLYVKGRRKECLEQLTKMAQTNGVQPFNVQLEFHEITRETSNFNFIDLFKTSNLRRITLLLFYIWFVNSFVFYGLSLGSSVLLSGNPFFNFFLAGLVEIPANLACLVSFNKLGRPIPFCVSMFLAGVTLFIVAFVPADLPAVGTTLGLVGKAAITCSYAMVYLFTAEIYPTVVRGIGLSGGTMMARLGAVIAPFAAEMGTAWRPLPMIVFGGFTLVAAGLTLWLPETKDRPLTQTIADAEIELQTSGLNICRRKTKKGVSDGVSTTKL